MPATRVPFVDLRAHHESLAPELQAAFTRVLGASSFILGEEVAAFEREFAAYVNAKHAVGVGSGLDALRLSLVGLGIGPGDEVVVPANTYIATALAVSACGATPVLADVEDASYGLDPSCVEAALTPRTKAIIPVHLYGQPCRIADLQAIAARHGLALIEDACQAHGARLGGRACGTFGAAGCFSFYPSKNLGALGDGGLVVTDSDDLAARLRLLRDYGQVRKYYHSVKGVNSRLDGLQAAILRAKLPWLDACNQARAAHTAAYWRGLEGLPGIVLPALLDAPEHVYHLFVIAVVGCDVVADRVADGAADVVGGAGAPRRDALISFLANRGIQTGIHYPVPIHLQEAYADLGRGPGSFPVTERLAGGILSLPMYPELSPEQRDAVVDAVRTFVQR